MRKRVSEFFALFTSSTAARSASSGSSSPAPGSDDFSNSVDSGLFVVMFGL